MTVTSPSRSSLPPASSEAIALARLSRIAGAEGFLPDQQTGFRHHRCTADTIADVVSTVEDSRSKGEEAVLVLLDVRWTFRVRVRRATSDPRPVTVGVPQGCVLSPFLFSLEMAVLPATLPVDKRFPTQCSLNADDVALWVRGPRQNFSAITTSLQRSLKAVASFQMDIGLCHRQTRMLCWCTQGLQPGNASKGCFFETG
ncbi:hypothetical protein HPB52_007993 [Rhipicephalus sanguineus]|uniref:Reverse transcriptase domain-containing protein n=1 Tax=Rhipicephalus sanguineus TaxID=34632 RepID=A0A9D4Q674_RHISA|nr:hypothetical protein HPB52_007993 [Rhipicephalus sanguineus]